MRVLFAGSGLLAVPSLEALVRSFDVAAVLTAAGPASARGRKTALAPLGTVARELNLPLLRPEKLNQQAIAAVRRVKADVLVGVGYGKIFRKPFLDLFGQTVNLHPSLLPKYRGPSPIQAAILAGDRETGLTIHRIDAGLDSGPIMAATRVDLLGHETTGLLTCALGRVGAPLLVAVLERLRDGALSLTSQCEGRATYCPMIRNCDGLIDWSSSAQQISRMTRAYDPWPGTYTALAGTRLRICEARVFPEAADTRGQRHGLVMGTDKRYGILVVTGDGILGVGKLQVEYKKVLDWRSFVNGNRQILGATLAIEA